MLNQFEVDRIVNGAALATLKKVGLSRTLSTPTVDSDGEDALRVTIVVADSTIQKMMDNDLALDAIVRIKRDLSKAGDDRFPIVKFATEREMEDDGGS